MDHFHVTSRQMKQSKGLEFLTGIVCPTLGKGMNNPEKVVASMSKDVFMNLNTEGLQPGSINLLHSRAGKPD